MQRNVPNKPKFGILGAMPQEVALMARSMNVRHAHEVAMRTFYEGSWSGQDVVLTRSRVGKVSAAVTTLLLLERFQVTHILFTGVAGAIDPSLNIGDIIVADQLIQHDMDASPLPAFQRFEVPLLGKTFFETDPVFLSKALNAAKRYVGGDFFRDVAQEKRTAFGIELPKVRCGLIASGDQFLADSQKNRALRQALPTLLCAEMEGAAVAQVCHEMGDIPAVVIRVISDQADHKAVGDFLRFVDEVAEYLTGGIVRTLLESFSEE